MTYVGVAGGRGAGEGVVHVDCPLETFAGVGVSCGQHHFSGGLRNRLGIIGWRCVCMIIHLRELPCYVPVGVPGSGALLFG